MGLLSSGGETENSLILMPSCMMEETAKLVKVSVVDMNKEMELRLVKPGLNILSSHVSL